MRLPTRAFRREAQLVDRDSISIVHLVTNHPVDDVRVAYRECRSLRQAGYDITLVAADSSGTALADVPTVVVESSKGRLGRLITTQYRATRAARKIRPTLIHFHDPELLPSAFLLRLFGYKVIYDVHEDMPKVIQSRHWLNPSIRPALSRLMMAIEWLAGYTMSGVVTTVPSIYKRFPMRRTVLVQNFPERSELTTNDSAAPYDQRESGLVCWAGALSEARGAIAMAEAISKVEFGPARLELAGRFDPPELADSAVSVGGPGRVQTLGVLGRADVLDLYNRARVGLMLYQPTPSYIESQPIKLFEYMNAGIPIVASDFPFIRSVLETHGCGICVDPTNPAEAADAIEFLLTHPEEAKAMGARGREAIELFTWEAEFEELLGLYRRVLGF